MVGVVIKKSVEPKIWVHKFQIVLCRPKNWPKWCNDLNTDHCAHLHKTSKWPKYQTSHHTFYVRPTPQAAAVTMDTFFADDCVGDSGGPLREPREMRQKHMSVSQLVFRHITITFYPSSTLGPVNCFTSWDYQDCEFLVINCWLRQTRMWLPFWQQISGYFCKFREIFQKFQ